MVSLSFGCAFYPGFITREYEHAFARVFPWGQPIVALASASEGFFSSSWPVASSAMLSWGLAAFRDTEGSLDERLHAAMAEAQVRFGQIVREQRWQPAVDGDSPYATLIMGALSESQLRVSWIGAGTAVLVRGFAVHEHTEPHTLRRRLLREQPDLAPPESLPDVLERSISAEPGAQPLVESATFDFAAGDTVLLFGKLLGADLRQTLHDAALAAGVFTSAQALARTLCVAMRCTVVAMRVNDSGASEKFDALLGTYEPPADQPAWLGAWAKEHKALPVLHGPERILAVRSRDVVLSVGRNGNDRRKTREETAPLLLLAATVAAARTYPTLQPLLPTLPWGTEPCKACHGALGQVESCRGCGQVGFTLPRVPPWFDAAQLAKLEAEAAKQTAALRRQLVPWWRRLFARWLERDDDVF